MKDKVSKLQLLSSFLIFTFTVAFAGPTPAQTPAPTPRPGGDASLVSTKSVTLDGVRINYQSHGKGEDALILIHGWSSNLDFWRGNAAELAKRNRVINIDLPGHGKSDKPETTYSMDYFARGVEAVMTDAGVKRGVLVGHSMGTPIARQFYRKYPEKTLAIIIVDGSLRPFADKKFAESLLAGFRGPNFRDVGRQLFASMSGPSLSAELKQQIDASFMNTPQHVGVSAMEQMFDDSIWGLDTIKVPVLAVMAKSPFWPADTEQFYRGIAPKIDFQMWEGVGHFLHMERPKQFNDAVIAFLNANALLKK